MWARRDPTVERIGEESQGNRVVDCKGPGVSRLWGAVRSHPGSRRILDEGYIIEPEANGGTEGVLEGDEHALNCVFSGESFIFRSHKTYYKKKKIEAARIDYFNRL